jgi:hypothetical protein
MKPICGTIVVRKKGRAGKEDKVRKENTKIFYFQCLCNFLSLFVLFLTDTMSLIFWCFMLGWEWHFQ